MNEYEIVFVYDKPDVLPSIPYRMVRQATSEADARALGEALCFVGEVVESVTLLKRGVVPHDLSSGTSEC